MGPSWAISGHFGAMLGPSWCRLGSSWGQLGFRGRFGPHLGRLWGQLGVILGFLCPSWVPLGHLGAKLGPFNGLLLRFVASSFAFPSMRQRHACTKSASTSSPARCSGVLVHMRELVTTSSLACLHHIPCDVVVRQLTDHRCMIECTILRYNRIAG